MTFFELARDAGELDAVPELRFVRAAEAGCVGCRSTVAT